MGIPPPTIARPTEAHVYTQLPTVRDGVLVGLGWHLLRHAPDAGFHCAVDASDAGGPVCVTTPEDVPAACQTAWGLADHLKALVKVELPDGGVIVCGPEAAFLYAPAQIRSTLGRQADLDPVHPGLRIAAAMAADGHHVQAREWLTALAATLLARNGARLERDQSALIECVARLA